MNNLSKNAIVEKIVNDLKNFEIDIKNVDYIHNKEDFFKIMRDFRKYLVDISEWDNFDIFYHSKHFNYYKSFFSEIHDYYLRSLEAMQSLAVMTRWMHKFDTVLTSLTSELIRESFLRKEKELWTLDFSRIKNFVFAWNGPFPETILFVYENYDIENILWLDYNHEAVFIAWEMINGLWYKNISFKHIDARKFDYSNVDAVSIPLFVPEKNEVIDQIVKTSNDNIQILVTVPKWFLKLIYNDIGEINNRLKIVDKEDVSTKFAYQEIIKLEKYNF